ncbi:MAG: DUF1345 domain-containing protein [Beijerinckiaceae bacterium]|nr:DUF1345 domain-containing protein [Beijerinckiaceae bacterium]MCI0736209.1 DUF1345 domain-containing protein [Beijerinckiaceae bacterium]
MPRRAPLSWWRRFWFTFSLPVRVVRAHPRLFSGAAAGILAGVLLQENIGLSTRLLIAWNTGAWLYFIASGIMIARASPQTLRWRAKTSDEGRLFILLVTCLAAIASIAAIVAQLAAAGDTLGIAKGLHVGLAAMTIITAWLFIHLTFAFHYAHEYFDELPAEPGKSRTGRGGLIFPGTDEPDYYDFLYFSYVIGVACQTGDVAISSGPMRRAALVHGILAFFFNSAVLALTINIAAGLM